MLYYTRIKDFLIQVVRNPLEVTIERNLQVIKEYGMLESLLRSILLPVESKKAIKEIFRDFFLILLPICTFFVIFSSVISGSMYPTLHTGDYVLASNAYYGGKFTAIQYKGWLSDHMWMRCHSNLSLFKFARPKKGHIILFSSPIDRDKVWSKRIVGEQGETVQFKNGILFINDIPVKLKFKNNNYILKEHGKIEGIYQELEETLPNGVSYSIIWNSNKSSHRTTPKYLIPPNCYFVVGDNRDNSADSRSLLGFIHEKHISGRVMFVWIHHQYGIFGTLIGNPLLWIKGFNFKRFFLPII
jgi:signal peptidase I